MTTSETLHPAQRQAITLAGTLAEMFSFNRSLGQIFGLVFVSIHPLSLEEIAKTCRMSKGNASLHLRTLETWGAVRRSWLPGTRKDYYAAANDLKDLALRRLQEGMTKRLEYARQQFKDMREDASLHTLQEKEAAHIKQRIKEVETLLGHAEKGCHMLPKILGWRNLFK